MAKKPKDDWQPLLIDITPKKENEKPKQTELKVEYDVPVRKPPKPAEKPPEAAPWWNRVRQIEADPERAKQPVLAWGASWERLLTGEGWIDELRPGKRALLEMSVRGLEVRSGVIEAGVGGGKTRPERVQLRFAPLTSADWARLVRQVIDDQADTAACAALESGQVPLGLIDASDRHGMPLLPRRLALVVAACTCGGARLPCDHVLAVHLSLCRKLDAEPLAILAFRGGQPAELIELFDRVREEMRAASPVAKAEVDPFAPGTGPEPDWSLLSRPPTQRPPLSPPEGWRARETLDAMVRRLVAAVGKA